RTRHTATPARARTARLPRDRGSGRQPAGPLARNANLQTSIARLGVSERVARSRELVARGFAAAAVARVLQVTRQAIYRTPTPRRAPQRRRRAGSGRAGDRRRGDRE